MSTITKERIAIIPLHSLGDSLVYTIIAQSYSDIGLNVTLYSNTLAPIHDWFKTISINTFKLDEKFKEILSSFDYILCDPAYKELLEFILKKNKNINNKLIWVTSTRDIEKFTQDYYNKENNKNVHYSGTLRPKNYKELKLNMVKYTQQYCKSFLNNPYAVDKPTLTIPKNIKFRKNINRVSIFPFTPNPEKNYDLNHFIILANKLKEEELKPEFLLTNEQASIHKKLIASRGLKAISFKNISELAEYIYESGSVISNDSGGGHLASLLGIPTVTIHKKKSEFEWRPGWKESKVIRPILSLKIHHNRIWSIFVRKKKIVDYIKIHSRI